MTVGAVHGLGTDVRAIPGRKEHIGRCTHAARSGVAAGRLDDRVPGTVISAGGTLVAERCLEFHRLVRVLLHVVGAGQCAAAGVAKVWPGANGIHAVVVVAVVRMAFEAHLVFTCDLRRRNVSAGTNTALNFVRRGQREKRRAAINRFHARRSRQRARRQVGMAAGVFMGTLSRITGAIEQAVAQRAVRVMTVGALRMPIQRLGAPERRARFVQINIQDIVRFGRCLLIAIVYRHMIREREIAGNVLDVTGRIANHGCRAVALVTGFFHRRVAAGFRDRAAVRPIAQQAAGAVYGVGIVTIEARRLPHRCIGRKLALGRCSGRIDFISS